MVLKELIESIMGKPNPKEEKNNSDIDNEEKEKQESSPKILQKEKQSSN